jgi:hypothetical protein
MMPQLYLVRPKVTIEELKKNETNLREVYRKFLDKVDQLILLRMN